MLIQISNDINDLAQYLCKFIDMVGREAWYKRLDQYDREANSPYLNKIISDYHWIEMAVSFQADVLAKEGRLRVELIDAPIMAALIFAAITVEINYKLSASGRRVLEGRLRDSLKAEVGFSPLYLEIDLAYRLMKNGFDVEFPDMEGRSQFDLFFSRNGVQGEIECKSLSADAGRQIHRKHFYRFMDSISSALSAHAGRDKKEVLVVTLRGRLSASYKEQAELKRAAEYMLQPNAPTYSEWSSFNIRRTSDSALFGAAEWGAYKENLYSFCQAVYGSNVHVAGGFTEDGGCIVVMRSQKEDDTSKPMLDAMRKASTQFSSLHPAYIAVQVHGFLPEQVLSLTVQRQAAILSSALYYHYNASHVCGVYVTSFGVVAVGDNTASAPGFVILNPELEGDNSICEVIKYLV